MANIEIKFTLDTDSNSKQEANGVPSWYPSHVADKSYWWNDGGTTTDYFYSINGNDMFIQYGQNTSIWAACRHFVQSLRIEEQKENPDGSILVKGEVVPILFASHKTDYALSGVQVQYSISIQGKTIWTLSGSTTDEWQKDSNVSVPIEVTVKPGETYTGTAMQIKIVYPNHEYEDSNTLVGLSLYNPVPPTYKPMAIRKSNSFKTLNRDSGFIKIRKSNQWEDKSSETYPEGQEGKGKNRIRKKNVWKQQSKIGID